LHLNVESNRVHLLTRRNIQVKAAFLLLAFLVLNGWAANSRKTELRIIGHSLGGAMIFEAFES
jgi:hypothetical protein